MIQDNTKPALLRSCVDSSQMQKVKKTIDRIVGERCTVQLNNADKILCILDLVPSFFHEQQLAKPINKMSKLEVSVAQFGLCQYSRYELLVLIACNAQIIKPMSKWKNPLKLLLTYKKYQKKYGPYYN